MQVSDSYSNNIESMSVAEVRKALAQMRKEWSQHSVMHPFCPCKILIKNMTTSEFAFEFVMGHHHKRHQKNFKFLDEKGMTHQI